MDKPHIYLFASLLPAITAADPSCAVGRLISFSVHASEHHSCSPIPLFFPPHPSLPPSSSPAKPGGRQRGQPGGELCAVRCACHRPALPSPHHAPAGRHHGGMVRDVLTRLKRDAQAAAPLLGGEGSTGGRERAHTQDRVEKRSAW